MEPRTLNGQCLCGTVRYEVEDSFAYAMNCHCSKCRRATGAACKPFAGIAAEKVSLTAGAERVLVWGDPAKSHDVRCGVCGSFLYSIVRDNAYAHVVLGTLMDAPSIRPSAHICVASKAPWHTITDDLPQHDGLP